MRVNMTDQEDNLRALGYPVELFRRLRSLLEVDRECTRFLR